MAIGFTARLPSFPVGDAPQSGTFAGLLQGGLFVLRHDLLLPILLCAVFWNFSFAALLVVMIPLVRDVYLLDPGIFGVAISAFGLAAIAGSWLAGKLADIVRPNKFLLFVPAVR